MSDLFLAFVENERREAELREIFDALYWSCRVPRAEVRSCRAICRWIVFSGFVLSFEAAQLGLARTVQHSNSMVDWAVQWHRQVCRRRSNNRVRLRNDVDSSSNDTDESL